MCGITGFIHLDDSKNCDPFIIKRMSYTLSHRGPDGEGFFVQNNLSLGHRRLSIIDLTTGDQPMISEDKRIALVFNGEIYNYIELKEELAQYGHKFKTNSDSEVIIKSYLQWGLDCQNRFNGMWAFALWDQKKHQLFLSRDRIGEKPLYYALFEETLIFGSEIKSIFAYGIPKNPNMELLEIYLSLGYIPAPYTFFKNIKKLKAGHYIIVCGKEINEYKYWDLPEIDEKNMLSEEGKILLEFENLLRDSVKIRMRSDVPYGAFLSGGLDSSSVVSLMSDISSFPVETFTIGFEEKQFDERYLARLVAGKFNTNHHEHVVQPESFDESLKLVAYHYDEPFGDSSAIPTGHVSRFAAKKVKMVLTGDGGDEVLSGYTIYQGEKFASYYQKLPFWIKNSIPNFTSSISSPFHGQIRYKMNRIIDVCESSNMSFIDRYLNKILWCDLEWVKKLTSGHNVYPIKDFLCDFEKKCSYHDPFYKLMYFNHKLSLSDDMLVKVDRMSMAYSLETRTPFLDYRLIEFLAQVHKNIKMHHFERKSILRNTIGRSLPKQILYAPKRGFGVPLREWFKEGSFVEKLKDVYLTAPSLDRDVISEISDLNQNGKEDLGNFIWMLFILKEILN
jgi:asparagine synthase (glutamine-hydrolysing)